MQQYFVKQKLNIDDQIILDDDIIYHLKKVLRKDSSYTFRIVDNIGEVYLAHLIDNEKCSIISKIDENNELDIDITCILSLIKNDKFELCIQKLVELGVNRIVPYMSKRSVIRNIDDKKIIRWNKIALEAAEQSHRNIVPEVYDVIEEKDLNKYMSKYNYICYEKADNIVGVDIDKSITYIVGPEGGFEDHEYQNIVDIGFKPISLGKRILRAETAAIYISSVIVSKCQ